MDNYFKLPTGYACLERSSNQVRAYTSDYRTRDTFELINFQYQKVNTQTNTYAYTPSMCLPNSLTHLIPESISGSVFVAASIFLSILMMGLFHVFKR